MTDLLKLPFHFDVTAIRGRLATLPASRWQPHYNKNDYEGNWTVMALRSGWGHPENIYSVPMPAANYHDTPLMKEFPEVQDMLAAIACEKTAVRFMNLATGSDIKEHCDDKLDAKEGEARLHIPIQTHAAVEFYLDGHRVHLQEGECWYLNFSKPHRVKNPGPADRIHLVIDCISNEWLNNILSGTVSENFHSI